MDFSRVDVSVIMWISDINCLFSYVVIVLVFILLILVPLFVVRVIRNNIDLGIFVSLVVCLNILWVV